MEVQNNSGSDPGSSKKEMIKIDDHFYHFNLI